MRIFPAIDIRDGKVVRLTQGDYDRMDVYAQNPADTAARFKAAGAEFLHIVDLDGALDGIPVNFEIIKKTVESTGLFVQVGGGVRSENIIERYLEAGASRVILGSAAAEDYSFVERSLARFGNKIAVGVDAKDGFVAIHGWRTVTDIDAFDFCVRLRDSGVNCVIFTDISKDGLLSGANIDAYRKLTEIDGLNIIASGGITYPSEIKTLSQMRIYGAILGKALYTGKLKLDDALKSAEVI